MKLEHQIEAILFHLAEPVSIGRLCNMLHADAGAVNDAIALLRHELEERGIRLLMHADQVELVTSPDASALITEIIKEELSKDLSKSALETLAIVLYKGPLTRSEIDYIRGVNSTFILRNLLVRGLVEKVDNPNDMRSFLYQPTTNLLKMLGVTSLDELPQYHETLAQLAQFGEQTQQNEEHATQTSPHGEEIEKVLAKESEQGREEETYANIEDAEDADQNYLDASLESETHKYDGES